MSVVLLIITNSSPAFSDSQTSQFKPHPSSGKYSAIACRSTGNNAPIQFSGNATTSARTFLSPSEIIGGDLRSNADIKISGNGFVHGDATPAPGHIVNKTGNATVTGSIQPASELLDCSIGDLTQLISWVQLNNNDSSIPPTDQGRMPWGCGSNPLPNDPWQFCLKGNETIHLSGGTYWFSSWNQSGNSKIIIDGYVRILVTGSIGLSGNLSINADGNPYNLLIFAIPDNSFSLQMSGNTILNGLMYGPSITAQLSGQSTLNGNLISQELNASGQAKLKRWIDETSPKINFTAPTATCLNSQDLTAKITITDNESGIDPESIQMFLNDVPITYIVDQTNSSWRTVELSANLTGLSSGNYILKCVSKNRAGSDAEKIINFIIDTTPPLVAITYPANGAPVQQGNVVIMGIIEEANFQQCGLYFTVNGNPVEVSPDGQWLTSVILSQGQTMTIEAKAIDGAGNVGSHTITISNLMIPEVLILKPMFLELLDNPPAPFSPNGVMETNEVVVVKPHWANATKDSLLTEGVIGTWNGPIDAQYIIWDSYAWYDDIAPYSINTCTISGDPSPPACFSLEIENTPAVHRDAWFEEFMWIKHNYNASYTWPVHIGNSFDDVPQNNLFYKDIETMLHYGIAAGCLYKKYCPDQNITRGDMAVFIARVLAMADVKIPSAVTNPAIIANAYSCLDSGWHSLFVDISNTTDPNDPNYSTKNYCRYVHYLYLAGIVDKCGNPQEKKYCPKSSVTGKEFAKAVALAITLGNDTIPDTYSEESFYSCDPGISGTHFNDVPANHPYCKYIHYLWAKGITGGCTANSFCPDSYVTRGQFAKFLASAFNLNLYKADTKSELFCPYSGNISWGLYGLLQPHSLSNADIDRSANLMSRHCVGQGMRTFINSGITAHDVGQPLDLQPYKSEKIGNEYYYELEADAWDEDYYWPNVARLVDSINAAGVNKKLFISLGNRYQCMPSGSKEIVGPWCHNNNNTNITTDWIDDWLTWNSAPPPNGTGRDTSWVIDQYMKLIQKFMDHGINTFEIFNEAQADNEADVAFHKDIIEATIFNRLRSGIKIQVNLDPPKMAHPKYPDMPNMRIPNFNDAKFIKVWSDFVHGMNGYPKVDYFAVHSIIPEMLDGIEGPGEVPDIPSFMRDAVNDYGEKVLEISTDGQHKCFGLMDYLHFQNGEILKALLERPEFQGINFEHKSNGEGIQSFEKIKDICMQSDIPLVDIKAVCSSDGPIEINCPDDIEINWTSINADSCTVSPTGWTGTSGMKFDSIQNSKTYMLDCAKGSNHYIDKVTVYCK